MRLHANTQPKQLEQQNNRLKEATAKVYYTESVGIIYIRRQSIADVDRKRFGPRNLRCRSACRSEERLAEQL